jgi:hypothetical protein
MPENLTASGPALFNLTRRQLLVGAPTLLILPGCVSSGTNCAQPDAVQQALCRQQAVQSSTVRNVTAGIIIGAALGAGFAYAAGGDPVGGALAGALIGGGVAAAKQYLDYKMAQANYQQAVALAQVKTDVATDTAYARQALADLSLAFQELKSAFANQTQRLIEATERAEKSKELVNQITINTTTFVKATEVYSGVFMMTPLQKDQQAVGSLRELDNNAQKLKEEQHKAALLMQYGELAE